MNWSKWSKHYQKLGINPERICRDGILNEEEWKKADKKILFILKEANDYEGGDLTHLFKDGPIRQMWHAIARWSAGILHNFPTFEEIDKWLVMKEAINKVPAINLKKTSGGATADMSLVNTYAYTDKALILEQIYEIQPDIAIACGTFDILIWLLGLKVNPDNPYDKPVLHNEKNIWIIPWRHPGRVNNKKTYSELNEMLSKI